MIDLFLVAAALGAFALGERRPRLAALLYALIVLAKPVGVLIAAALVCGSLITRWREERAVAPVIRASVWPILGISIGGLAAICLNWLSWQHLGYSYDALHSHLGGPVFSPTYLTRTAPVYLLSLIALLPGMLVLGPLGLWRRRCYGPLLVVVGLTALMASYFFFDRGRSRIETAVLAQRLILPASAFMILGYADVLAPLFRRPAVARVLSTLLVLMSVAEVYGTGTRLRGWQRDGRDAVMFADEELTRRGSETLGTTQSAMKAGLMHRGPVRMAEAAAERPAVVICNLASGSYRFDFASSCAYPGYDTLAAYGSFRVLAIRRER
jgi:hypothetical protein